MFPALALVVLLATRPGGPPVASPPPAEATSGPFRASLTVTEADDAGRVLLLRVVLRNVSGERQALVFERPGAEFFVKDERGHVVHHTRPCVQAGPCEFGLAEHAWLDPGATMEFVDRWTPPDACGHPGNYVVKAKVRVHPDWRPAITPDIASLTRFTLETRFALARDTRSGKCVVNR